MKIEASDVKRLAQSRGLEVLQPAELTDPDFNGKLFAYNAELFCVVAFRILPQVVFAMPPRGTVNLHASLLPKYRGAAPINWAIIRGERETGLTTFFIRRQVDSGDIIMQEKAPIGPDETFGELHDEMADLGGELLVNTIDAIESGTVRVVKQDSAEATNAPKLLPEHGNIDWTRSAVEIHNLIRGLSPKPAAYTFRRGKKLLVVRSRLGRIAASQISAPGRVIEAEPQKGITVSTGAGSVELLKVRPESGKTISGAEYVRGYRLTKGEVLEKIIGE